VGARGWGGIGAWGPYEGVARRHDKEERERERDVSRELEQRAKQERE